jgi:hypothetical protein
LALALQAAIAAAPQQGTTGQTPPQGTPPPTQTPTPQPPPAQGTQPPTTAPSGQQPPTSGQQPPQAQQQQTSQAGSSRSFSSDAGMFFNNIRPDKTADFEMIMGRVKEALAKNPDPLRKQQAASWKVFKAVEPGAPLPDGTRAVLYVFVLDPVVKNADYTITKILSEAFPSEVQDLYTKLVACYPPQSGQSIVNLQAVMNMSPTAAAGGR